jgi:hypothetical protein
MSAIRRPIQPNHPHTITRKGQYFPVSVLGQHQSGVDCFECEMASKHMGGVWTTIVLVESVTLEKWPTKYNELRYST